MRLFEFDQPDPLVTKLIAVSDQLHTDLDDEKTQANMTVDKLLQYFQKYDIVLDQSDLYNMIKKPPLKNLISNIEGDKVIFKGFGEPEGEDRPDEKRKMIKAMAAKAAKR